MLRGLLLVCALSSVAAAQELSYSIDLIDWEIASSSYAEVKKDGSATGFADDDFQSDFGTSNHNDVWSIPNADLYVSRDNGVAWAEVKECSPMAFADTIFWGDTGLHQGCSIDVQLATKARVTNPGPNPVYQSTARGWARGSIEKHLDITDPNRGQAQLVEASLSLKLSASDVGYHNSESYQAVTLDGDSWLFASWEFNEDENIWMWKMTRKLRRANSTWENPTPPHHVVGWYPNNDGLWQFPAFAVVVDNFYIGAYANMNNQQIESIAKTPTGGSNPYPTYSQLNANPKPRVYVKSVTKAW